MNLQIGFSSRSHCTYNFIIVSQYNFLEDWSQSQSLSHLSNITSLYIHVIYVFMLHTRAMHHISITLESYTFHLKFDQNYLIFISFVEKILGEIMFFMRMKNIGSICVCWCFISRKHFQNRANVCFFFFFTYIFACVVTLNF